MLSWKRLFCSSLEVRTKSNTIWVKSIDELDDGFFYYFILTIQFKFDLQTIKFVNWALEID